MVFVFVTVACRSEDANCEVVMIGDTGALVALKNIRAGDWLTVAPSDDDDDNSSSDIDDEY